MLMTLECINDAIVLQKAIGTWMGRELVTNQNVLLALEFGRQTRPKEKNASIEHFSLLIRRKSQTFDLIQALLSAENKAAFWHHHRPVKRRSCDLINRLVVAWSGNQTRIFLL